MDGTDELEQTGFPAIYAGSGCRPSPCPSYEEHLKDYRGNLLPHSLIADICRWVIAERDAQSLHVLQLLSWLKVHFADMPDAKDDVDNAIAVSFIEHLPPPPEPEADVVLVLGPKMKAQYEQFYSYSTLTAHLRRAT